MAKRRKKRKQKAGVSQRVSQRQVTVIHVGDQKSKRRKKVRRKRTGAASAAEAATAAISASMGRPVDLGLMDPQLQQVLDAHSTMQRQTLYNTPYQSAASRYGLSASSPGVLLASASSNQAGHRARGERHHRLHLAPRAQHGACP